jgi:hypothetical protein
VTTSARRLTRSRVALSALLATLLITTTLLTGVAPPAHAATPAPVGSPPQSVVSDPGTVYAGVPVSLLGDRSSDRTGISEWEWDLDGDGDFEVSSTSESWVSTTFPAAGRQRVTLRVRNGAGLVASTSTAVRVRPAPAAAAPPAAPAAVAATATRAGAVVRWTPAAGPAPLTYEVVNTSDATAAKLYVGPTERRAEFPDLPAGRYTFAVRALNAAGPGPVVTTAVAVRVEEDPTATTDSASPTASSTATASATESATASATESGTTVGDADEAAATIGSDDDLDLLLLAGAGGLFALLVVGAVTWAVLRRRRQRTTNGSDQGTAVDPSTSNRQR